MDKKPHVMVIPYPLQGHVGPLMKLAYKLVENGVKVTVVNTEFIHAKIMAAMPRKALEQMPVSLISVPDGLESDQDRKDPPKLIDSLSNTVPGHLQDLIERISSQSNGDEQITCVIADSAAWWALEVARKMCIKRAAYPVCGVGVLAMTLHVPKLIEAGIIGADGIPIKDEFFSLSKEIPAWHSKELKFFPDNLPDHLAAHKYIFKHHILKHGEAIKISNWLLTNSFYELEPSACELIASCLPIGPLLRSNHAEPFPGNFWPEESTCLSWLDKHPAESVIYVAFGSLAVFSQEQFNELALGLELTGLPFLWVVRLDFTEGKLVEYPDGFKERTVNCAQIVEWAPQEIVLSHPSTACFFSHCGWNSTMEGVSMGVPFLCWPYFADQYHNKSYICETWKVGLGLDSDESGIVTRHEIRTKVEKLISDDSIKANSLKLKEMARKSVSEGGSSFKNFKSFIEQLQ